MFNQQIWPITSLRPRDALARVCSSSLPPGWRCVRLFSCFWLHTWCMHPKHNAMTQYLSYWRGGQAGDQYPHKPITHPCSSLDLHYHLPWRHMHGQMIGSPHLPSPTYVSPRHISWHPGLWLWTSFIQQTHLSRFVFIPTKDKIEISTSTDRRDSSESHIRAQWIKFWCAHLFRIEALFQCVCQGVCSEAEIRFFSFFFKSYRSPYGTLWLRQDVISI